MQFKAKSKELEHLSAVQLINGDQKTFSLKTEHWECVIGFAVVETTDDEVIMSRKDELLLALVDQRKVRRYIHTHTLSERKNTNAPSFLPFRSL